MKPPARGHDPLHVVCVTPVVPHDGMDNAGGNYLQAVHRWWVDQGHRVDVLAPDVPINRRNRERPGAPTHVRLPR